MTMLLAKLLKRQSSVLQSYLPALMIALMTFSGFAQPRASAEATANAALQSNSILGSPVSVALTPSDLKQKLIVNTSIIYGDRMEYWADDEVGQFIFALLPPAVEAPVVEPDNTLDTGHQDGFAQDVDPAAESPEAPPAVAAKCIVVLHRMDSGSPVEVMTTTLESPSYPKFHLKLQPGLLTAGSYRLTAWLEDDNSNRGKEATWDFTKSNKKTDSPAFPRQGLSVQLQPLTDTRTLNIPVTLPIPLPKAAVKDVSELVLTRHGKIIPAQFKTLVTWGPGGSIRWAQAKFNASYEDGKAEGYTLQLRTASQTASSATAPAVRVEETTETITLDNGTLRLVVNRQTFSGIETAWYDATGKGNYKLDAPIIVSRGHDSGPFLMDERLVHFTAAADTSPSVTIEDQGSQSVTILATGWYTDRTKRVPPLCQYNVRLTLSAGQSMAKIDHHTIITFDTRLHKIRDLGFAINYTNGKQYAFGVDGQAITGELPQKKPIPPRRAGEQTTYAGVSMHQQTWDKAVVTNEKNEEVKGSKSDGWVATWADDQPVLSMSLMHVWQKFPKELEARNESIVVHAWPSNGKRVFSFEEELDLKNIYKFWGFHQHRMLDLSLTQDYYEKLDSLSATETRETRAEHALNGNGQGMTITTNMALHVSPAIKTTPDTVTQLASHRLADARLFELRPFASLDPSWNAESGALEPMAAVNPNYEEFEQTILSGLLAYGVSVEQGNEYGMFIWPDIHTYWLPDENRATLHRTWVNSHYHNVGNSWVLWFRSGDARMLRWARDNTMRYRDVATIAYAEPLPRENAIKFHIPGAMYHNKGCTPWGSETHGMIRRDTHAGLYGHWVDPDAHLWAWLIDGETRGHDLYNLWVQSLKTYGYMHRGVRREANTTIAVLVNAYEFTGDPDYLPAIHNLGYTLRTKEPLPKQNPGPMWHPLWINRYYQLTRDPAYVPFILEHGHDPYMGNTWNLALAAQAYELSGDASYLTQHLRRVEDFPRQVYREKGAAYDYYGMGPGPLGMNWGEMGVGSFMRAINKAGIQSIPKDLEEPIGGTPLAFSRKAYTVLLGWSRQGGELNINTLAMGIEGDAHRGVWIASDSQGNELASTPTGQAHRQRYTNTLQVKPDSLTTLRLNGYGGINMNTTGFDAQAGLLDADTHYMTSQAYFHMQPLGDASPVTFNFSASNRAAGRRAFCNVQIKDANGKIIITQSFSRMFDVKEAQLTIDPKQHPLPWVVDLMGAMSYRIESATPRWLIAPTVKDLNTIKPIVERDISGITAAISPQGK